MNLYVIGGAVALALLALGGMYAKGQYDANNAVRVDGLKQGIAAAKEKAKNGEDIAKLPAYDFCVELSGDKEGCK